MSLSIIKFSEQIAKLSVYALITLSLACGPKTTDTNKKDEPPLDQGQLIANLAKANVSEIQKLIEDALGGSDQESIKKSLSGIDPNTGETVVHYLAKVKGFKPELLQKVCTTAADICTKAAKNNEKFENVAIKDNGNLTKKHLEVYSGLGVDLAPVLQKLIDLGESDDRNDGIVYLLSNHDILTAAALDELTKNRFSNMSEKLYAKLIADDKPTENLKNSREKIKTKIIDVTRNDLGKTGFFQNADVQKNKDNNFDEWQVEWNHSDNKKGKVLAKYSPMKDEENPNINEIFKFAMRSLADVSDFTLDDAGETLSAFRVMPSSQNISQIIINRINANKLAAQTAVDPIKFKQESDLAEKEAKKNQEALEKAFKEAKEKREREEKETSGETKPKGDTETQLSDKDISRIISWVPGLTLPPEQERLDLLGNIKNSINGVMKLFDYASVQQPLNPNWKTVDYRFLRPSDLDKKEGVNIRPYLPDFRALMKYLILIGKTKGFGSGPRGVAYYVVLGKDVPTKKEGFGKLMDKQILLIIDEVMSKYSLIAPEKTDDYINTLVNNINEAIYNRAEKNNNEIIKANTKGSLLRQQEKEFLNNLVKTKKIISWAHTPKNNLQEISIKLTEGDVGDVSTMGTYYDATVIDRIDTYLKKHLIPANIDHEALVKDINEALEKKALKNSDKLLAVSVDYLSSKIKEFLESLVKTGKIVKWTQVKPVHGDHIFIQVEANDKIDLSEEDKNKGYNLTPAAKDALEK